MDELRVFTHLLRMVDENICEIYGVMQSWDELPMEGCTECFNDTSMLEVDELREELQPWLERGESWRLPCVAWLHDLDQVEAVLSGIVFQED